MILWKQYKDFSSSFLAQYHNVILYDVFHHIKAFLLYPLNCSCKDSCCCNEFRTHITLSLNVDFYNKALERGENADRIHAMRSLLRIPEESYFRKHYTEAYPLWLVDQEFRRRHEEHHFKIVSRLVWMLLRLGRTYEVSSYKEPRASLKEAIGLLVGKNPLKTKKIQKEAYLCGEKAYATYFHKYKSVCHFIAAFEFMREDKDDETSYSFSSPAQIAAFFNIAEGLRIKLLSLKTPNVKEKSLFSEANLISLPPWLHKKKIDISLTPLEDKLAELNKKSS